LYKGYVGGVDHFGKEEFFIGEGLVVVAKAVDVD
jgi:hypothetical protein